MRCLCFYDAIGYAPTKAELYAQADRGAGLIGPSSTAFSADIVTQRGRCTLPDRASLIAEHERRERWFARKLRRARWVAWWLSHLDGVRYVALCNTTALAHADEASDLDFFVIVKQGALWQTRGWAALPFKLFGLRPTRHDEADAVCLSFFVDDGALDLAPLALPGDDPYLRYWFLSLLPLFDDGVSQLFWDQNTALRTRHPQARKWITHPAIGMSRPWMRVPSSRIWEGLARRLQEHWLSADIRRRMNVSTDVVVHDHVLKFHVEDRRDAYRHAYIDRCQRYGVAP